MVVATSIPRERRIALESLNVECREMSTRQFRNVARAVGYTIESEKALYGAGDIGDFGVVESLNRLLWLGKVKEAGWITTTMSR